MLCASAASALEAGSPARPSVSFPAESGKRKGVSGNHDPGWGRTDETPDVTIPNRKTNTAGVDRTSLAVGRRTGSGDAEAGRGRAAPSGAGPARGRGPATRREGLSLGLHGAEVLDDARRFCARWRWAAPEMVGKFQQEFERVLAFFAFSAHWRHRLRTTNLGEGWFKHLRRYLSCFPGCRRSQRAGPWLLPARRRTDASLRSCHDPEHPQLTFQQNCWTVPGSIRPLSAEKPHVVESGVPQALTPTRRRL